MGTTSLYSFKRFGDRPVPIVPPKSMDVIFCSINNDRTVLQFNQFCTQKFVKAILPIWKDKRLTKLDRKDGMNVNLGKSMYHNN